MPRSRSTSHADDRPHPLDERPNSIPGTLYWSFWSFILGNTAVAAGAPQGNFYAEIIFGVPTIVSGRPVPPPPRPVRNLPKPMTSADIVGIAAGSTDNLVFWCNGAVYQSISPPVVQSQSVILNSQDSNPGISVTVNNGAVNINDDWVIYFTELNLPGSTPYFFLGGNQNGADLQLMAGYTSSFSYIGFTHFVTGTWALQKSWAMYGWSEDQFSLQNPPLALPAFPPGGPFFEG
jgi:hypothetical protein